MLGSTLRAHLLQNSVSKLAISSPYANHRFTFHILSNEMNYKQKQGGGSSGNSVPVLAARNYSGGPFRSNGGGRRNESQSLSGKSGPPSKSLLEEERDLDNWFEKREISMPCRSNTKRGRNNDSDNDDRMYGNSRANRRGNTGSSSTRGGRGRGSRNSYSGRQGLITSEDDDNGDWFEKGDVSKRGRGVRGGRGDRGGRGEYRNGVSARGGRAGPLKMGPRASLGMKALKMSEDEDEDEDDDEDDEEFDFDVASGDEDDELHPVNVFEREQPKLSVVERAAPKSSRATGTEESYLSQRRFDECKISPLTLRAIKDAGYANMTIVQEATLPSILNGKDVLAKAKTGTGKTLAFLLPSIEVILKSPPIDRDEKRPPIVVLIICPTRELASQAAAEAETMLKYHANIGVQVVIGGTKLSAEQKRLQANPCQMLVATPGRLQDHIENTPGFSRRLMGVKVLILDEADHLLDMGFRKAIDRIIAAVPKQRQTLLFSATVPEEVHQVALLALRRDHEFINTVEEGSEETHSKVSQRSIVASHEDHFHIIYAILKEHISQDPEYKVLVFCTTAMVTRLVAEVLSELKLNVREIHSRKSQGYRTRVSDEFRKSKGLILVTSDVSARGVDYPDVTLVIQVGLPSDREQYIHRLGRTGRKGKEGQGILLLAPWEEYFLRNVKDLPIMKAPVPVIDSGMNMKVKQALSHVEMKDKESAYQAWLGYYNSVKEIGRDKSRLVELANEFSRSMGLDTPPAIKKLTLSKMGLKNVPGLRSK
uniref:ATP-dependent RNA helicase n=1 Tax=Wollemia nobilis TaxID=56998 RepID=A0A0C9S689_9CONI